MSDSTSSVSLADLTIAGFLDPATGSGARRGAGDYAAIATVARDTVGHFYVLDVWMKRTGPSEQVRALFDLHEKWDYTVMGLETNCFQQFLLEPIEAERARRRETGAARWQLPLKAVHQTRNKEQRIAAIEPLAAHGWLRFASDLPQAFWRQLEAFPRGRHDDGLDAVEGAVSLLRSLEGDVHKGTRRRTGREFRHF